MNLLPLVIHEINKTVAFGKLAEAVKVWMGDVARDNRDFSHEPLIFSKGRRQILTLQVLRK